VDHFSKLEEIISAPIWKQQPTSTLNYLCTSPNCYSTCFTKQSFVDNLVGYIPLIWAKSCPGCNHRYWFHSHLKRRWVLEADTQISIDCNMKKKWEVAKDQKEQLEVLIETSKRALSDLRCTLDHATDELARLTEEYANLSLSGSFSANVEKAIQLLEQSYRGMEERAVGPAQLERVRGNLERMHRKLELLRKTKMKAKEGVRKVKQASSGNHCQDIELSILKLYHMSM
jgi:hypothetical protein